MKATLKWLLAFLGMFIIVSISLFTLITFIAGGFAAARLISAPQEATLNQLGAAIAVIGIYAGVIAAYLGSIDKQRDRNHPALSRATDAMLTATTFALIGLIAQFINVNYLPQWWAPIREYNGLFTGGSADDFTSIWNGAPRWYRGFQLLIFVPGVFIFGSALSAFIGIATVLWVMLRRIWDTYLSGL